MLIVTTFVALTGLSSRLLGALRIGRLRWTPRIDPSELHRLKILAESIQDSIIEFDDQGIILFVSDNTEKISDLPIKEMIGRPISEFMGFQENSIAARSLAESGRITEQAVNLANQPKTTHVVMPDGSERWFESTGTTYRTAEGELRILTRTRDITARIEQEARTKESEIRLLRAERIANLGSWEYYPQEERLLWSDQMYRLHGLEPKTGSMDLDQVRDLMHGDDFHNLMRNMLASQPSNEARYRIERADDGTIRNLFTRGEVKKDDEGNIVRVSGASMDITEQLELEERLRRGQEHFRALVESNIVGMFFSGRDGQITEANDAFLSLLGYTTEDLPLDWQALTPPGRLSRDRRARRGLDHEGIALPYEKEFISKGGEVVPMLVGYARLDQTNVMALAVDLSERRRAEAFVKQYQKELEETIAERTCELMKSRDRLIENDRLAAVGTLAAGVAHQINNPIGAILNSAEFALLCRDEDDSVAAFEQALQVNLTEARRCAQIVKSMLLFSRDERTPRWSEDLRSVVHRAHRAIAPYAADRSATVEICAVTRTVLSNISPIEIEQAIVNVLRNAIESRDSGAAISLSLTKRGKFAEIEILDDGRGISQEQRDHLFEPFYSTRTNEGGTGLGLSVAHGILTDHGGQIQIDSIPGEGTRVLMTLPVVGRIVELVSD